MKLELTFISSNDGGNSRFGHVPLIDYIYRYQTDASAELFEELTLLLRALEWIEDAIIITKRKRLVVVVCVSDNTLEHKDAVSVAKFIAAMATGIK